MQNFCFCTLALGREYRNLALLLVKDLENYSPGTKLIILTDRPEFFQSLSNVLAFKHLPQSCKIYNDKRLAIAKAFSLYNSVIFTDADVRILDPIPDEINFQPGIVAYSCCGIVKHNTRKGKISDMLQYIKKLAGFFDIDLDNTNFVQEYFFYVTKDEGVEEFLNWWELMGNYLELKGCYHGEGNTIGLAATKANLPVYYDYEKKINLFKDRVSARKKRQDSQEQQKIANCYQERQQAKNYQSNGLIKIVEKINKAIGFNYRLMVLKLKSMKHWHLYRQIDKPKTGDEQKMSQLNLSS